MAEPNCDFTEMWAVKMRKVFHSLDRENKGECYKASYNYVFGKF